MNSLEDSDHNLSSVQYDHLFDILLEEIQQREGCLAAKEDTLIFDIDILADAIAQRFASSKKYPFENNPGTTYATVYVRDLAQKEVFSKKVQAVQAQLQALFLKKLGQKRPETYLAHLFTPIADFTKENTTALSYPLNKTETIEKQRLHLSTSTQNSDPWLKAHKLTLHVKDIQTFDTQIMQSIYTYLESALHEDEDTKAEDLKDTGVALETAAAKPNSQFSLLREAVVKQSVARIHREAKVRYLRYLLDGMKDLKKNDSMHSPTPQGKSAGQEIEQGVSLLSNLIRRLQGLDFYIRQEKEKDAFRANYQGTLTNYVDIFSREDAFDPLPIIPEVDGFLGESTDPVHGTKTFVSGLKLKLNGSVQVHGGSGQSVFEYNLGLLDASSLVYKAREASAKSLERFHEKVLKVALLYCFVFIEPDDPNFRAGAYFEKNFLPALQSDDKEKQLKALYALYKQLDTEKVKSAIEVLRKCLSELLLHRSISPTKCEYPLVLSIHTRLLQTDVDKIVTENNFFQETFDRNGGKNVLKYIAIEEAHVSNKRVCSLPLTLMFEPIHYFAASSSAETFSMTYETEGVQTLPIFLAPVDKDRKADIEKYANVYKDIKRVALYYRHRKEEEVRPGSERAFVYRFMYMFLSYSFLHMLSLYFPAIPTRKLFLPLICIHAEKQLPEEQDKKVDDEAFIHDLSKVLEHMLAEDHTASSQGFYLDTVENKDKHKLKNALYSLYTALPRVFRRSVTSTPRQLQKLAIIVVSSRKCDFNSQTPNFYLSSVQGEVIGIECRPDQTIRVGTLSTFSDNQDNQEMYRHSDAVLEQVQWCYNQGYRHFLYVARAPYSSTLHISDVNEKTELYFMNKEVIQGMRAVGKDVKVYPVFCDKYYVVNRKRKSYQPEHKVKSLYVDDIAELSNLANDPSRKSLIFFNLFSGATINPNSIYNGVISYATLTNVYEDLGYEQYLWADLLNKKEQHSLGSDILDYITLLHFSRNEKSNDSRFKLDPFVGIIGDKSVGKAAIIPNMLGRVSFNMLAFLTEVRAALRADS